MRCPYCDHDNIPGTDLCETCGAELAGLDLPEARGGLQGHLLNDRIGSLELTPPLMVKAADSIATAIRAMREAKHGCVLVEEDDEIVGIFTERDVLVRVVRHAVDPEAGAVGDVMTPKPLSLTPEDPPAHAIHLMLSEGLRHLPIADADHLAGFISVRNVLEYIRRDIGGWRGGPEERG
jgi:CBS domain-containing protein